VRRIKFIARKEFYHILRDVRSLVIVFAMPIIMTFLYGYAINLDVENIVLAVVDHDQTQASRDLTEAIYRSTYFSPPTETVPASDPAALLRSGDAVGLLYVRPGLGSAIERGEAFEIGLIIDGSDNSQAVAVQSYATALLNRYMLDHLPEGTTIPGVQISQQVYYNPDLESSHFFVPGLVAVLLMMISALLTSITIAREKETGTMEQLLTAPVTPIQLLIGKLLPYIIIALVDGVMVLVFAAIIFGMPFQGSHLLLLLFGLVYVATSLSLGILISTLVRTQQVAMMAAMVGTLLPSVMLSGFIFAVKNMPLVLQVISNIVAAKFFIVIIRGIMLKGAGLESLIWQAVYLIILMAVLLTIAVRRFNTRVA
jgi:ABC-2 type transport system permease protein